MQEPPFYRLVRQQYSATIRPAGGSSRRAGPAPAPTPSCRTGRPRWQKYPLKPDSGPKPSDEGDDRSTATRSQAGSTRHELESLLPDAPKRTRPRSIGTSPRSRGAPAGLGDPSLPVAAGARRPEPRHRTRRGTTPADQAAPAVASDRAERPRSVFPAGAARSRPWSTTGPRLPPPLPLPTSAAAPSMPPRWPRGGYAVAPAPAAPRPSTPPRPRPRSPGDGVQAPARRSLLGQPLRPHAAAVDRPPTPQAAPIATPPRDGPAGLDRFGHATMVEIRT